MEALTAYSLVVWFWFFLLNYAEITSRPAKALKKALGAKWGYPLSCAACWAFWTTLALSLVGWTPWWYLFAAPVVHLFIDLGYSRLSESHTTQTYQAWREEVLRKPLP